MGVSKYSNETKVLCIENGVIDFVKNKRKELYQNNDLEGLLFFEGFVLRDKLADCSARLIESEYRKYTRAREHIRELVSSGRAVFITLTFTDEVLSSTSAETRRRYVSRYLKEQSDFYVANIDYSPGKQREHYHAVVSNRCDMSKWRYGFVWCEKVRTQDYNAKRVARYVAKLTSHAFKVNASRLLYSRNCL